jgi:AcrR family transcriptional regulator
VSQRPYDNSRRREAADLTRRQIIDAGCAIARESEVRDWGGLTIAAVAERAGVSERTVYRHLGSEAGLREAVLDAIQARAGIDLDGLQIGGVAGVAALIFRQVAAFRTASPADLDPALSAAGQRQRDALTGAVSDGAPTWSEEQQRAVAAVLDVLWSPAAYERLVRDWGLSPEAATAALTWAVRLVERTVTEGPPPVDDTTTS